jgi:hypothetical protein
MPDEARMRAMSDERRMWSLRMKFLAQAKKYFGVPYARKYWTDEGTFLIASYNCSCLGERRRIERQIELIIK